jgi:hypothetical protein
MREWVGRVPKRLSEQAAHELAGGRQAVKKSVTITSAEPGTIQDQRYLSSADDYHLFFHLSRD